MRDEFEPTSWNDEVTTGGAATLMSEEAEAAPMRAEGGTDAIRLAPDVTMEPEMPSSTPPDGNRRKDDKLLTR